MLTELIAAFKAASWPMAGQSFHGILFIAAVFAAGAVRLEAQTPEIIPLAAPQPLARAEFRVEHAPTATNCFYLT